MAHKVTNTMTYTEVVYYDDDGNEVARDRQFDDTLHDEGKPEPLTDTEREDFL